MQVAPITDFFRKLAKAFRKLADALRRFWRTWTEIAAEVDRPRQMAQAAFERRVRRAVARSRRNQAAGRPRRHGRPR